MRRVLHIQLLPLVLALLFGGAWLLRAAHHLEHDREVAAAAVTTDGPQADAGHDHVDDAACALCLWAQGDHLLEVAPAQRALDLEQGAPASLAAVSALPRGPPASTNARGPPLLRA